MTARQGGRTRRVCVYVKGMSLPSTTHFVLMRQSRREPGRRACVCICLARVRSLYYAVHVCMYRLQQNPSACGTVYVRSFTREQCLSQRANRPFNYRLDAAVHKLQDILTLSRPTTRGVQARALSRSEESGTRVEGVRLCMDTVY